MVCGPCETSFQRPGVMYLFFDVLAGRSPEIRFIELTACRLELSARMQFRRFRSDRSAAFHFVRNPDIGFDGIPIREHCCSLTRSAGITSIHRSFRIRSCSISGLAVRSTVFSMAIAQSHAAKRWQHSQSGQG